MVLYGGRGAHFVRLAAAILLPLSTAVGGFLYFLGKKWGLSFLIIVSLLLCLHWPSGRSGGDDAGETLPVQQPATGQPPGFVGGLRASVIAALPEYAYEKKAGGDGDEECAVCLGEVQLGEVVKRLPACAHLFHAACIDAWLLSRVTCPVCRAPVDVVLPAAVEVVVPAAQ
ncbi:hypothetical protein ACP4OV_012935 [Aristida adscensionis]